MLQGSTNTLLAAALAAMGVPLHDKSISSVTTGDGIAGSGRVTWYFEAQSLCGKHRTAQLVEAWENKAWHEQNPEHPFAYIKCAFENHSRLLDKIKRDVPLGLVKRRGKIAIVSLSASQHFQDVIFQKL